MSAISAEPQTITAADTGTLPYADALPRVPIRELPRVFEREAALPRRRARSRVRPSVLVEKATLFLAVTVITCAASSLSGQIMVEKARREGLRAQERASVAQRSEAALRIQVNKLASAPAIEIWAQEHGFVTVDSLTPIVRAEAHGAVAKD